MKHLRVHIVLLFVALAAVVTLASYGVSRVSAGRGQSQSKSGSTTEAKSANQTSTRSPTDSLVKPTSLSTSDRPDSRPAEAPLSTTLSAAAAQNAQLQTDLTWIFGGKQQRGWYLYTSLINRLLKTDAESTSNDFASAVGRWQQQNGLKATGVLDEDSFKTMLSAWQGARLKNREYAQPDQLLTAPVADFYDPSRAENLRQVERETYAAYKRMIAAAMADPSLRLARGTDGGLAPNEKFLKIVSAFRPREYQEQLRKQSPNAGSAGLAVNSPHFTGRALDLYVGGDPVDTKDANRAIQVQTAVYKWLVRNAEDFGFRPYCYEPWHWEYVR